MDELLAEAGFLRRVARGLASDSSEADDLVQETFVAALEHPPHENRSIRGWLATVAANLSRNKRRERSRREHREHVAARAECFEDERVSQEKIELQRTLFELLLTLPAEQRTVVYLRYYEEQTPTAIAEQLGVPLKTVKSRHTRAMTSLRERLDARSGGDRRVWMEALLVPSSALRTGGTAGGVVAATIGGIAMKKLVLVAIAAVLAALAWFAIPHTAHVEPAAANAPSMPANLDERPAKPAPAMTQTPPTDREPVATTNKVSTGALEVHLSWSDGTLAANVGLEVQCESDPAPRDESSRAFSDASGVARFDKLFAGKVKLIPDLRERFEGEVEAGTTRTITHTFEKGEEVRGRVIDPAGAPVASAEIWCKGADWRCPDTIRTERCATDGTFRLRDVVQRARIDARAPHFRASSCFEVAKIAVGPSGSREIELILGESGGRVSGHVLDPDGTPLEHAMVLAGPRGWTNKEGTAGVEPQPGTVVTDKEGAFEIVEDLAPGKQPIYATAPGYPVWEGTVDVAAGTTASIEIRLEHSSRIEGRVIGLDDRPIAGIKVVASKETHGGWYFDMLPASKATSDEQGRFALDWLKPGECELNASDYMRPEVGRAQTKVVCIAGQTLNCDVHLERGNTISGHVQSKDGSPLAGWKVYSQGADFEDYWTPRQAKTDATGGFTLINLGPGNQNLIVRGPEFEPAPRAQAFRIPLGTKDVELVVEDANVARGTLRARIVDPSGHSLKDVEATMWKTGAIVGSFLDVDPGTGIVESQVQPGRYRIEVRRSMVTLLISDDFVVSENQITEAGDLTIGATGRAEVRITGLPTETTEFRISLEGPGRMESARLELDGGVWKSKDIASGRWFVTISAQSPNPPNRRGWRESEIWIRDGSVEITPGATGHFDLVVEPAHRMEFTFANSGEGMITIETQDAPGRITSFRTVGLSTQNGKSNIDLLLPVGRSSIVVRTIEGMSGKVEVDVEDNRKPHPPIEIPLH